MNDDKIEKLAEELGAVASILKVIMKDYKIQNDSSDLSLEETDVLLEYANGYIENCFLLLQV